MAAVGGGSDPLQQQSAQLAQQAAQDNARREQTGGKKKSIFVNLLPYIGGLEFDLFSTIIGNFQAAGNLSQISIPGIVNHFRMDDTSLIPNGKLARRDIAWFFEQMHQGQSKEDTLFGEKQKSESEKSERESLLHKSQEDPNREYNEKSRSHHQNDGHGTQQQHHSQKHEDSDGNYWRGIQMAANQLRMAVQKNDHSYDQMVQDAHHQREWLEYAKGQWNVIQQVIRDEEQRKRNRAQSKVI
jgi:hypothetical protein